MRQVAIRVTLVVTVATVSAAGLASCRNSDREADLKPPPGFVPPAVRPLQKNPSGTGRLGFGHGFFSLEVGSKGETWRWMSGRGEVRLPNRRTKSRLHIVGWIPLEFLKEAPTIRVSLDDHVIDTFRQTSRALDRDVEVPAVLLGAEPSVLLVLETSNTGKAPHDYRDLGISIEHLSWDVD